MNLIRNIFLLLHTRHLQRHTLLLPMLLRQREGPS
ncbi:hypothetical protein QQP08_010505 [Theobroma cacao]|nr:hypothetical protein QQP08_010505 [Theobroma cacao]